MNKYWWILIGFLSTTLYAQNLNLESLKHMGSYNKDKGKSIIVDDLGNIYSTGSFQSIVDFDPGIGVNNLMATGFDDMYIQKLDSNGKLVWIRQIGGDREAVGNAIVLDDFGNIYITGYFTRTVDFDPGIGINNLTSNDFPDMFVLKLDVDGYFLWVKQIGGSFYDEGSSIALDNQGNVYTTGYFNDTVDFDPGVGVNTLVSNGYFDIYIQKLDSAGNFLWVKRMGGNGLDEAKSIAIDNLGNIYTTGCFSDSVDFDPGVGTNYLYSNISCDIYIQKLDSDGDFLWVKQMGGNYSDIGNSIVLDDLGNIYTTGSFSDTVDFDPNTGVSNLISANIFPESYVQKLDPYGNFLWAKSIGGISGDEGASIKVDSLGSVYTCGFFSDTVDFDPDSVGVASLISNGRADIYIQKLDSNGNFLWAKSMGGPRDDIGKSLFVNFTGTVLYTTGWFDDIFDMGWCGTGTNYGNGPCYFDHVTLDSYGGADIYIQKLSTALSGINEKEESHISIYPNPTDGIITINSIESIGQVKLFDYSGRIILETNDKTIDLSTLDNGIYFIEINRKNEKMIQKVVKQ